MRTTPALLATIALAAAGCVNAPDDVQTAAADAPTASALADATVPYAFDGSFGPMLWACALVTCEGVEPAGERWSYIDLDGTLTATTLTITWDATTPNMETIRFGITWETDESSYESVEGTSPLVLELTGLEITPDDKPYVWTWIPSPTPVETVYASTPTDFHVEGTLTLAPAPTQP